MTGTIKMPESGKSFLVIFPDNPALMEMWSTNIRKKK
jgi:hypothetical protein